jgi:hypothetical protein
MNHLRTGGFLMEAGGQIRLLKRGKALVRVFAVARSFFKHRRTLDVGAVHDGEPSQRSRP